MPILLLLLLLTVKENYILVLASCCDWLFHLSSFCTQYNLSLASIHRSTSNARGHKGIEVGCNLSKSTSITRYTTRSLIDALYVWGLGQDLADAYYYLAGIEGLDKRRY